MDTVFGVIRILQSGVTSNWWGLGCPSHCGGASWGVIFSAFFAWISHLPRHPNHPWLCGFLDFACLSFRLLRLFLSLPLVWLDTWMSQPVSNTEVIELSVNFSGLSITVRGSPDRAADFVRGLSDRGSPSTSHHDQSLDLSAIAPSTVASSAAESRSSIPGTFPLCPAHWLARGKPSYRLTNSWESESQTCLDCRVLGQDQSWRGRISSPNRSEAIELQNKFWCVVFCQGVSCPRVFTSSRAFFGAVGPVEGSSTICHAFPSETEARVYLEGAGLEFPDLN